MLVLLHGAILSVILSLLMEWAALNVHKDITRTRMDNVNKLATTVEHGIIKLALAQVAIKVIHYAKESALLLVLRLDIITTIMETLELEMMMIIALNMDLSIFTINGTKNTIKIVKKFVLNVMKVITLMLNTNVLDYLITVKLLM